MRAAISRGRSRAWLRAWLACCVALVGSFAPRLGLAQVESGFDFCPPPFAPRCVQDEATYVSPDETAKCQEEVNRYVTSVGAYRLCLTRETERAVRETNATLQLWKCSLSNDKALCK